jgi:hypothetical protein
MLTGSVPLYNAATKFAAKFEAMCALLLERTQPAG